MKYIIIASTGENVDSLYTAVREFPTERIILLTKEAQLNLANKIKAELEKFKIPIKIIELKGDIWEETFKAVYNVKKIEDESKLLINVSLGDNISRCAITSAAFVNGIKAFASDNNVIIFLPVLKFSYYKMITEKKMEILKTLYEKDCCSSLEELSKRTKMSLPLISYHINGTLKSEGLKKLGLVETVEKKGKLTVTLTTQGILLIKGYIS